jgi:hypothetical protein
MSSNAKPVAKGDILYVERRYTNKGESIVPHTVESVGRAWINLSGNIRVEKDTLKGDMLIAYQSIADYDEVQRVERLRRRIASKFGSFSSSNPITPAQIDAIGEILGLNGDLAVTDQ